MATLVEVRQVQTIKSNIPSNRRCYCGYHISKVLRVRCKNFNIHKIVNCLSKLSRKITTEIWKMALWLLQTLEYINFYQDHVCPELTTFAFDFVHPCLCNGGSTFQVLDSAKISLSSLVLERYRIEEKGKNVVQNSFSTKNKNIRAKYKASIVHLLPNNR